MGVSVLIFLFFFPFLCFPCLIASIENCQDQQCSKDEPAVTFPFRLKGRHGEHCGYQGFDLSCNTLNKTVLELPFSGVFVVQSIYHNSTANEIQLRDPDNCLPRRLLNKLNLSGTPFFGMSYKNYSFFNCSSDITFNFSRSMANISCLSSSTHRVIATSETNSNSLKANCGLIDTITVPKSSLNPSYGGFLLRNNLHLTWRTPSDCRHCETTKVPSKRGSEGLPVYKKVLIYMGIIVPILLGFACCTVLINKEHIFGGASLINLPANAVSPEEVQNPPPQWVVLTTGLDGSTIESYPTVILGDSRRLPSPYANTCSICLSEYQPKETLKSLSACDHFFHADCIDVWLRINSTFFFFLIFFPVSVTCQSYAICTNPMSCGVGEPPVRLPFRLAGRQSKECGYEGFDLSCNSLNKTVLQLPNSQQFYVQSINYASQEIHIYDPGNCLPMRLLKLHLPSRYLLSGLNQEYTFLNCSSSSVDVTKISSSYAPISCMSSSTNTILATNVSNFNVPLNSSCKLIATVTAPVARTVDGFSHKISDVLLLKWQILPDKKPSKKLTAIVYAVLGFILALSMILTLVCCICPWIFGALLDHHNLFASDGILWHSTDANQEAITIRTGLDDSTIRSYQQIILDEKLQLPNPNDTTCSICLSEYLPTEMLKIIPLCDHYFHATCIDPWLRMHTTCPVCRKSLQPSLPAVVAS
ncbi:hypothetical protein MKW94_010245 [Papaver nudicaule]|uniref:RING-type E3 ubiquitin transferase n=1 Tax=Papaver nudicaule TaxID=74823 RepID=A0AA41S1S9_PAPNU|nr:hypothetical protein [Papaver nudicaule]